MVLMQSLCNGLSVTDLLIVSEGVFENDVQVYLCISADYYCTGKLYSNSKTKTTINDTGIYAPVCVNIQDDSLQASKPF